MTVVDFAGRAPILTLRRKDSLSGAGFWLRCLAAIFDLTFILPMTLLGGFLVGLFFTLMGVDLPLDTSFWFCVITVVAMLYRAGFESSRLMATPGKFICKLVVVLERDLGRVSFFQSATRFLVLFAPLMPIICLIMICCSRSKRGLHDMAGSCTVLQRNRWLLFASPIVNSQDDLKRCPVCAEKVQAAARICHYCRHSFDNPRKTNWARMIVALNGVVSCSSMVWWLSTLWSPPLLPMTSEFAMQSSVAIAHQQRYLNLKGHFSVGDGARIIAVIQANAPTFIVFDSPGGSVTDAMEIGRFIRSQHIITYVADHGMCVSACFFAYIGGVQRYASAGAMIGVHQSTFPGTISFQTAAAHIKRVKDYVVEMGVKATVVDVVLDTPPNKMYYFNAAELRNYNVATIRN